MHDFDTILKELGQFGRYQLAVYVLLFFPLATFTISSMNYVFTTDDIDYRCLIPECENGNSQIYEQPWLQEAIPFKDGKIEDHCLRYKAPVNSTYNCSSTTFSNDKEECDRFVFENDFHAITKDFNLLCGRNDWKRSLIGTVSNIVMVLSMPFAGLLSDRFGKKALIVCGLVLTGTFGILRSFTTTYLQFIICETLTAISHCGLFNAAYLVGAEVVGPDMRGLGGTLIYIYFSFGEVILGAIVWLFNEWRLYLRIIYIPILIIGFLYYWIMPESIRWLIAQGKKEQANKTIDQIRRWNNSTLSSDLQKSIDEIMSDGPEKASAVNDSSRKEERVKSTLIEALKSKTILLRLLNCSYCWLANSLTFYGLSVYSVGIAGNKYLNFILVSFVEIPGLVLCYLLVNRGRKLCLCLGLAVSGAACLMFHFIPEGSPTSLILYFIGKVAISESSATICIFASELFPTEFRNTLFGFCVTIGSLGTILAPQVSLLAKYVDPLLVFSALGISASFFGLFFPETRNFAMPDTLEDIECMSKKKVNYTNSREHIVK